MRILIVGQYFWPENFRINEAAELLCRAGCSVTVLTGPPNYPDGKVFSGYSAAAIRTERRNAILVHRVPMISRGKGSALRLISNYFSFLVSACLFGPWLLRRQEFDVVLVYAPGPILQAIPGILLGAIKRSCVVTWVQDLWPESLEVTGFVRNRLALRFVALLVRWIYRHNDLLLVQSGAFLEPVRAMAGGTPVIYHPNPGDLPAGTKSTSEPEYRLPPGFSVVFAGNLGTVQALDTILDAAEHAREEPDLWWIIIGSGSRGKWLHYEVQRRGLDNVILPGRFPAEAMAAILAQASVLLVTLVRDPIMSRTVPSKLQAYLAAGRPIIAAVDGEGARVVVEARAGVSCPAQDSQALCQAVLQVKAMSANERARMGQAGRTYYHEQFDPERLTQRLLERLREVCRGRRPPDADKHKGAA